jgi:radical SAM superfamily enzyme YgiQ (UPF0313 family)
MKDMHRVFQGAATVQSILKGDLIDKAAAAGLRSLFVGFESLNRKNMLNSNKRHNDHHDYQKAIERLHELGIMINASFVFGMDDDDQDVFKRTVDWAIENGITTCTFHILTPYPGTRLYRDMEKAGRIVTRNWDLYDTRHVVFKTKQMSARQLEDGYASAYELFYSWGAIIKAGLQHDRLEHRLKHLAYAGGWKKFEPLWNFMIKARALGAARPLLEGVLSSVKSSD